jgi:sugar phosphate isomerase/epimerase
MNSVRLGLDLFSVRSQGWNAFQFLDYAAKLGVEVVHFSEVRFLGGVDDEHLRKVKAYAGERRLSIEAGMTSICPTSKRFNPADGTAEEQLTRMFRVARALGSPIVRCYLGSSADRPIEPHIAATVKVLRAVKNRCQDAGLKIAIENHAGDMQARELKSLIEEAGRDFVGACMDSGNPVWAIEDPHLTLETLAPYVLTTHIRDSAVWEDPKGIAVQWTALGQGTVGIDRWVKRFTELCAGKPLSLEIIVTKQPRIHNYLDPGFWDAFPHTPAWEFARFVKLAREGSPRYPTDAEADEKAAVERSLAYCKELLGRA